jgi:hypothetical protein
MTGRIIAALLLSVPLAAQTTQGLISGRVTNSVTGEGIAAAQVGCDNPSTNTHFVTRTGPLGFYTLPELPPGQYEIDVAAPGFQGKVQFEAAVGVAGSLDLDFALRPLANIWEPSLPRAVRTAQRTLIDFYGPDVNPNYWTTYSPNPGVTGKLEPGVSNAVRPAEIQALPLQGNDVYSILLGEPGVTASNLTSRSLGISANGMRPSSSNFLLDGADTNFFLIGGPLLSVAPEAVQEYRISTSTFSAEYGGAAGYIVNAIARSGGSSWHGQAYGNYENETLNANGFQENASGIARLPSKEIRAGYFVGGPLRRKRLFLGSSYEYYQTRDLEDPVTLAMPNRGFLNFLGCPSPSNLACGLLKNYSVPATTSIDPFVTPVIFNPPVPYHRWLLLERLDWASRGGLTHGSLRIAAARAGQPDFIWSPYPDYVSGLTQPVVGAATNWTFQPKSGDSVNRVTASWSYEDLAWSRAHPEVPTLVASGGNLSTPTILPGSLAGYGLTDRNRTGEIHDDQTWVRGRHILKFGGGALFRQLNDLLSYGQGGEYFFNNIVGFGFDQPAYFSASLSRLAPYFVQPNLDRAYRDTQVFVFGQDAFRISSRLVLNLGLRYDNFGNPQSVGAARDPIVRLGSGSTVDQRAAGAQLVPGDNLFSAANRSFAPRLGFSYNVLPSAGLLLRGGFGVYYDRLYDNLWLNARNNSFQFPTFNVVNPNYLTPVAAVIPQYANQKVASGFPASVTAFQSPFPNGYAEDFFLGTQQRFGQNWSLELNGAGSLGRRLPTNDLLNWQGADNSALPPIAWLGSEGLSDYYSLNLTARWRGRHSFFQAAYTWSHALDNQSDPLSGDSFNLLFVNPGPAASTLTEPGFSQSGDSRADRGSADFDQRHTLVFYGSWFVRGWTLSAIGALRSGFPYSIYTTVTNPQTIVARARTASASQALLASPVPVNGGERLFDASAFCPDESCPLPETSRNAFAGPGVINFDLALARSFPIARLGESGAITLRADFFNALNHANLNPPGTTPNTPGYGIALYGTPPASAGFPSLVPLGNTSRRIQLLVRVTF